MWLRPEKSAGESEAGVSHGVREGTMGRQHRALTLSCFSHVWVFAILWAIAHQTPLSMGFSRQVYCRAHLLRIFPTQGSNLYLYIFCTGRRALYHLLCLLSYWRFTVIFGYVDECFKNQIWKVFSYYFFKYFFLCVSLCLSPFFFLLFFRLDNLSLSVFKFAGSSFCLFRFIFEPI